MNWEKVKLGEICDSCLGKMLDKVKNKGELRPYLANLNVRWGEFETSNLQQMKFEDHELERYGIKYGDLIMCEGGEIGRCAIWKEELPNMMIQKALHRIRPKDSRINMFYLLYWFIYQGQIGAIDQYASGTTTIKHLPAIKLKQIEVDLPPRPVQDKIASILSAYDDMIDNCKKQIALLEEAAQRLYREWFVDLHFPGHESTPIGENGLPVGWTKVPLDSTASFLNGYAFKPKHWYDFGLPIIKIKELKDGVTNSTPRYPGSEIPQKYLIEAGDIIFSWSATLFANIWNGEKGYLNQHLFKVIPNIDYSREFVLQSILIVLSQFRAMANGSTMQHIQRGKLSEVEIIKPSHNIMSEYSIISEPIREQILTTSKMLLNIQKIKDTLLPRLISGQIEINA